MKTYLYKTINGSTARGYNQTIEVFRVRNNKPEIIGSNDRINTASSKGEKACASQLIAEIEGYKFEGYDITRKDVQLFSV